MAVAGSQQMPELTLERMQVSLDTWMGCPVLLIRGASTLFNKEERSLCCSTH